MRRNTVTYRKTVRGVRASVREESTKRKYRTRRLLRNSVRGGIRGTYEEEYRRGRRNTVETP